MYKLTFIDDISDSHSSVGARSCLEIFIFSRQSSPSTKKSLENVVYLEDLGIMATNTNQIRKDITRRLKWSNVCYHSIQGLFLFLVLLTC